MKISIKKMLFYCFKITQIKFTMSPKLILNTLVVTTSSSVGYTHALKQQT